MSRAQGKYRPGRLAARLCLAAVGAAMAGAALGGTAFPSAAAVGRGVGDPPEVSARGVMSALHVNADPKSELVFLVDLSDSMKPPSGLYPYVQQQLPEYLTTLQRQNSNNQVAVVVFGNPGTARPIYQGAPTPEINLPAEAGWGQTDFGQAFNEALSLLSQAAQKDAVQVGGVVLLSDGGMRATNDAVYDGGKGYDAPGWKQLRERASALSKVLPVTGYGVPLTTNRANIANQETALSAVFGQNVQTLPGGTSNLAGELGIAGQRVIYGEVTGAVAGDSGKGVQVTWSGLPGSTGTPLNLTRPGRHKIDVTLTSRTSKVPLYVTGLHLVSAEGPVAAAGGLPGRVQLNPGQSRTFSVTLDWPAKTVGSSLTGGTRKISGQLQLAGAVGSPWTQALQANFDDMAFSPGTLTGSVARFPANAAAASNFIFVLVPVIIVAAVILFALLQALLFGSLTLTTVDDDSGRAALMASPILGFGTKRLINRPGWMLVNGRPFSRKMTVRLRLADVPNPKVSKVTLKRGGQTLAAGVYIVHNKMFGGSDSAPPRYGRR